LEEVDLHIDQYLYKAQNNLLRKNAAFRETHTFTVDTYEEFKEKIQQGFVLAHRDGTVETAEKIQAETSAIIRCIPFDQVEASGSEVPQGGKEGTCVLTGKPSKMRVIFARSY